jgi:hypothetical protein
MITVGIDDTDTIDTPGTNQLARALVARLADRCRCLSIVRHQLLFDPRVPFTSKNGSASIRLEPCREISDEELLDELRTGMREWFVPGSDPGLCLARDVSAEVIRFGQICKRELVDQRQARAVAREHGIHLEGLGGTEGGVIGALAAVGLAATEDDGRIIQLGQWPDDLSGPCDLAALYARGIRVLEFSSQREIASGPIDVGKRLRPNYRGGQVVLYVERDPGSDAVPWKGMKLV